VTGDLPGNTKAEDGRPNVPAKVSVSGEGQLSVRESVFDLSLKKDVFEERKRRENEMDIEEEEGHVSDSYPIIQNIQTQSKPNQTPNKTPNKTIKI